MAALRHPYDEEGSIEDDTKVAAFQLLTVGPKQVDRERKASLKRYADFQRASAQEDEVIARGLTANRRKVAKGRTYKLFERLCADAGVKNANLMDTYITGATLVGSGPDVEEFPPQHKPASMEVADVQAASVWTRRQALGRTRASEDPVLDQAVWDKTREEIEAGWLRGPLTEEQYLAEVGPHGILARRFGVPQKEEVRVIDDLGCPAPVASRAVLSHLDDADALPGFEEESFLFDDVPLFAAYALPSAQVAAATAIAGGAHADGGSGAARVGVDVAASVGGDGVPLFAAYTLPSAQVAAATAIAGVAHADGGSGAARVGVDGAVFVGGDADVDVAIAAAVPVVGDLNVGVAADVDVDADAVARRVRRERIRARQLALGWPTHEGAMIPPSPLGGMDVDVDVAAAAAVPVDGDGDVDVRGAAHVGDV